MAPQDHMAYSYPRFFVVGQVPLFWQAISPFGGFEKLSKSTQRPIFSYPPAFKCRRGFGLLVSSWKEKCVSRVPFKLLDGNARVVRGESALRKYPLSNKSRV